MKAVLAAFALLAALGFAVPEAAAQGTTSDGAAARRSRATTATEDGTARVTTPRRSRGGADGAARPPTARQLAARERMRACGAEWRGIRGTPQAQNRTWRDFSRECLARNREGGAPARRRS